MNLELNIGKECENNMNKKGFTLVELLAVIAILAILVIIALPNVMGMFNTAKERSFANECKTILQQADQQFISDRMFESGAKTYVRDANGLSCSFNGDSTEIDLTHFIDLKGRSNLHYEVELNSEGKVISFKAADGSYQVVATGSDNAPVDPNEIGDGFPIETAESGTNALTFRACSTEESGG